MATTERERGREIERLNERAREPWLSSKDICKTGSSKIQKIKQKTSH